MNGRVHHNHYLFFTGILAGIVGGLLGTGGCAYFMGMGSRSGEGRGSCGTGSLRNSVGSGWFGRSRGMGRGLMGMGLGGYFLRTLAARRGFFPSYNPTSEDEASQLKDEAFSLKDILSSIEQHLGELETKE